LSGVMYQSNARINKTWTFINKSMTIR
jgi:hypothetical protein